MSDAATIAAKGARSTQLQTDAATFHETGDSLKVTKIAVGLTKAQREALMMAEVRAPHSILPNYWSVRMAARRMSAAETEELRALGLVTLPICEGPRSGWPIYSGEIHALGRDVLATLKDTDHG